MSLTPSVLPHKRKSLMANPFMRLTPWFVDLLDDEFDDELKWSQKSGLSLSEDHERFYIEADMPGLDESQIQVTIERGILRIQGERHKEKKDENCKYHLCSESSFAYRVAMPGTVDESSAQASYENGILKVIVKKAAQNIAKNIPVTHRKGR